MAVVRLTTETLSGIPSIVYGLFGSLFFVTYLKWSYSLAAGALTLAIMILPLVMRTTEEALKSVPDMYREGSFGLGAGKLRTVFCVVLPSAIPGILSGVILSIGRIVGETAALIYTAGSMPTDPLQHHGIRRVRWLYTCTTFPKRDCIQTRPTQRPWYFCSSFCLLTGYQARLSVPLKFRRMTQYD